MIRFSLFVLSLLVFLSANKVHAVEACGIEFRTQMEARAFLEMNREMMVGGGVVVQPDSVLEYTCFDFGALRTATTGGPIFTMSPNWQGVNVPDPTGAPIPLNVYMGATKLNTSIQNLVIQSLNTHEGNFAATFLGGTGGSITCNIMDQIFQFAKCENIMENTHLVSFDSLRTTDPRNYGTPRNYSGDECDSPIDQARIDAANNPNTRDPIQVFLEYFSADDCADPIPTGLTIRREIFARGAFSSTNPTPTCQEYADHVCATPGCYYNGSICSQSDFSSGAGSSSIPTASLAAGEECIK